MRNFLMTILMVGVAFSCTTTTTASLANLNTTLTVESCIYISDINATIDVTSIKQNAIIDLAPPQSITDSMTNNTYRCNYDILNYNQTLPFGTSYTNNEHKITVSCPSFPRMDVNTNITAGNTYYNSQYNITVSALHKIQNMDKTLTYDENFTDTNTNITIRAPSYPKLNFKTALSFGSTYYDDNLNLTVFATPPTIFDQNITVLCGQERTYSDLRFRVSGPPCANIDKTLSFGESLNYPEFGLKVQAPSAVNKNVNLKPNETYTETSIGFSATCESPSLDQYYEYCTAMENASTDDLWGKISIPENYTCNSLHYVCIDGLTSSCSVEEKLSGSMGFITCYNRVIDQINASCKNVQDNLNICEGAKRALDDSYSTGRESAEANNEFAATIIGGSLIIVAICIFGLWYVGKKTAERRS